MTMAQVSMPTRPLIPKPTAAVTGTMSGPSMFLTACKKHARVWLLDKSSVLANICAVDLRRKLQVLADAAKYDASCASSGSKTSRTKGSGLGSTNGMGICHSYTPDGRCVSLLKILFTNACIYDCRFCVNRSSSDTQRAAFTVAEVVGLTMDLYRRNYIEGLFLSSGIVRSEDHTMERLAEVARRLREDEGFGGYIHLKTIAGSNEALIARAGRYADRLSCNVELPTSRDLASLAPEKRLDDIEGSLDTTAERIRARKAERSRKAPPFAPAGQSTQMVIGATPTTDHVIMESSSTLYRRHGLRRVYYSAYSPIQSADPALPTRSSPLIREHRLYQADWLLRFYGFEVDELFESEANLPLEIDPKLSWALRHPEFFPLDLNGAPRESLLRVPGLGARRVERICAARRHGRLRVDDLKGLRVSMSKVAPFVHGLEGPAMSADARLSSVRQQVARLRERAQPSQQLSLFDVA